MTLLSRALGQRASGDDAVNTAIGRDRRRGNATGSVSSDEVMRLSVAWACRTLRAELVSTMVLNTYRSVSIGGQTVNTPVPKPPVLIDPAGDETGMIEWSASSQMDLDGHGNSLGVIEERDAAGLPKVIRLTSAATARVGRRQGKLEYVLDGQEIDPALVWHEKQYTVPGIPVGLSPIAYAALTASAGLSAAEFAADWFGNGATPKVHLKNTARRLDDAEARRTKARYDAQVRNGSTFVSGTDWSLDMMTATASESAFLEQLGATNIDLCRFFRVPGDLVDVGVGGASITYANITQRNLQFLIMNLGPVLRRREDTFSRRLLPAPRFAMFDPSSLLRMDPKTLAETLKIRIDSRTLTPSEARDVDNLAPLTEEQEAEFGRLFGSKTAPPVTAPVVKARDDDDRRDEVRAIEVHPHIHLAAPEVRAGDVHVTTPEIRAGDVHVSPVIEVDPTPIVVNPSEVVVRAGDVYVPEAAAPVVSPVIEVKPADVVLNGPSSTTVHRTPSGDIDGTTYHYES